MFSAGYLSITVSLSVPGNSGIIDGNTNGAEFVIEIRNSSVNAQDIEIQCLAANGLLEFDPAITWPLIVKNIPETKKRAPAYEVRLPIGRKANTRKGSETISCDWLRYRDNGAPAWGPRVFPKSRGCAVTQAG